MPPRVSKKLCLWDGEGKVLEFEIETIQEGFQEIVKYLRQDKRLPEEILQCLTDQIDTNPVGFMDTLWQMGVSYKFLLKRSRAASAVIGPEAKRPKLKKLKKD